MTDRGQQLYRTILPQVRLRLDEHTPHLSDDSLKTLGDQLRHLLAALSD